jgi:hypothetical protein
MPKKSLAEQAAALAAKAHKLKEPLLVHHDEALDPKSGKAIHFFRVVGAEKANEAAHAIILDESGKALKATDALESLFDRTVLDAGPARGLASSPTPITIQPDSNTLTLNPGETIDETITVTIPKNAASAKADVYFLADTTGSMRLILNAVQGGANNILATLGGLGVDIVFGVGNYKDFESGDPFCFQHQVSPTNAVATVTAAINAWTASGGNDTPEGNLFALDSLAVPTGGVIGWRAGSKRIIVWFGDAPGHDPICTAVSGAPAAITEASATAKLVAEGITVLAISTATPGLDDDPKNGAFGYAAKCGAPGGLPQQGTRIATNTGGTFVTGINAGNIVNTITSLVTGAVAGIKNVKLVPSASIAPFVTSITPAGGYGPLAGDKDHVLSFDVKFTGIPCKPEQQVFSGTLDVVADGKVVASKRAQITVPPCRGFLYSVKFVCGVQPVCNCECEPVQPGKYATEINIHNYSSKEIEVRKLFVPLVLAGAPIGREPRVARVRAEDKIVLPPHSATMDDCCRIAELLFGGTPPSPMPLTIGFLEITSTNELSVTAVYTMSDLSSGSVSIDVEQIDAAPIK